MNIAILSVSEKGKNLSTKLKTLLDEDPTFIKVSTFHKNVQDNINSIFNNRFNNCSINGSDNGSDNISNNNADNNADNISNNSADNTAYNISNNISNKNFDKQHYNNTKYDAIIGIMASGILIRNIADKIQDKTTDPAILSMDDNGKYVISLISGHLGGANDLTNKIAKLLKCEPVITTSTDTNGKIGIDTLATNLYWEISNKNEILAFNKAILEEKPIKLYINLLKNDKIQYQKYIEDYLKNQKKNTVEIIDLKNINSSIENIKNKLFFHNIDDEKIENYNVIASFKDHQMFFNPKKIVIGIGARANISKEKVMNAIHIAMDNLNLSIERIDYMATAEIKKDENGITDAAREIEKPLEIVDMDEIKKFNRIEISKSKFVQEKFDIPGVAEPSALIIAKKISNRDSKLIHKKIAIDGVTVSVAVSN